jgi:outer membrane protein assembly factor BamB
MRWGRRALVGASIAATVGFALPAAAAATVSSQALIATATTLTSSSTSTTRDSWLTFTAMVSAASGTPTGSVTFTDESNGSILDTAELSTGTATFSTAALTSGSRDIVAYYSGSGSYASSASAGLAIAVSRAGSLATAYQIDPRHNGRQSVGSLRTSSLSRKWHVTLGGTGGDLAGGGDVSYPVIARGRVFVTVENTQTYGTKLYALDARTGAVDWSVALPGNYGFSALTYDGRHIFALNFDGVLTAFVASTGHKLWSSQMPDQIAFTGPPTAYNGVVYLTGASFGGTVYAVSEADGVLRWTDTTITGDGTSPAVDNTGAYFSYACQQVYRFSLSGLLVWHHDTGCWGGGGSTPVLHGGYVYARGPYGTPVILSKSSGTPSGSFASATAPAFGSRNMYTLRNGKLVAVDPSGSPNRWTFGNGNLVTAPVVNGGVVFVGSSAGRVYGVSASSGTKVWSGTAGSTITGPEQRSASVLIGMAVGGGLLVVPAGNALTAFGD